MGWPAAGIESLNYWVVPKSTNMLPPTATLNAEDPSAFTPTVDAAAERALEAAQPAAPLSPVETNAVCPCAAACSHRSFQKPVPHARRWSRNHRSSA